MIVISTYNPDTKRTTADEQLLTTLLAALVRHAVRCKGLKLLATDELQKQHYQEETSNANRLIGLTYPLLGLDWSEVAEVMAQEEERWRIDPTGKK